MDKIEVIKKALEVGFEDIGFTTMEPFESQKEILNSRREEYEWVINSGFNLEQGLDPKNIMPEGKSIIVLIDFHFREAYPSSLEGHFGRAYLDDDRITRDNIYQRIKAFRGYLRDNGVNSKSPFNIPHRLTAARAGLGTFGRNNFLYSNRIGRKSSWLTPIPLIVDYEFEPDEPTVEIGCPKWCKNTCVVSCPTGALRAPNTIDPRKCISYLSYYQEGITPLELREPLGTWVYGCDRCQEVCPRNRPWLSQDLPLNKRVVAKEKDFDLTSLLHMDLNYYQKKIWPHMFYQSYNETWRWKMNVARSMGNSQDLKYIPELVKAFKENSDERVTRMIAWALGRLGGKESKKALECFLEIGNGEVREEISLALKKISL